MFADVTSANVVGYQGQETRAGFNYMTPTFVSIDGSDLSAQDMQADATVQQGEANIQILDKDGLSGDIYTWYSKADIEASSLYWDYPNVTRVTCPEGKNGLWLFRKRANTSGAPKYQCFEPGTLSPADAIQIYAQDAEKTITTAGAVADEDIQATTIAGFNYFGNPFPATISAQDFQADATVQQGEANIQILDKDGLSGDIYTWYSKADIEASSLYWDYPNVTRVTCPQGKNGLWLIRKRANTSGAPKYQCFEPGDVVAGSGVQLYTANKDVTVTILCPYDLKAN